MRAKISGHSRRHPTTTKAAINAFTKSLCQEAIDMGIRVNAVSPGPVWTPLNTYGSPPDKIENFGADSLLKRPAQPIELAPIFVLLASD